MTRSHLLWRGGGHVGRGQTMPERCGETRTTICLWTPFSAREILEHARDMRFCSLEVDGRFRFYDGKQNLIRIVEIF